MRPRYTAKARWVLSVCSPDHTYCEVVLLFVHGVKDLGSCGTACVANKAAGMED